MNRDEALSNLQLAINLLIAATAAVSNAVDQPIDTNEELRISLNLVNEEFEVTIFSDGDVFFSPSKSIGVSRVTPKYGQIFAQMQGKPKNLPPRTCPRCKGQGKI